MDSSCREGKASCPSPLEGYEPNAPVEVISTEVTPTLLLSRRGSIGSTSDTGDDIATTPAALEAGLTTVVTGETSANPFGIYHSNIDKQDA